MQVHGTASPLELVLLVVVCYGIPLCLLTLRFWLSRRQCDEIDRQIVKSHVNRKLWYLAGHICGLGIDLYALSAPPRPHTPGGGHLLPNLVVLYALFWLLGSQVDMLINYRRYRRIEAAPRVRKTP